jgi:tetratricopeptide (TPR) repeat protein
MKIVPATHRTQSLLAGLLLTFAITLVAISTSFGQELSEITMPPNGDNQKAEVSQWIGLVKVTIAYHSPNVHGGGGKDRTGHIWGELIQYGFFDDGVGPSRAMPWRAGANENTTITFSHDVKIESQILKAGTYALFLDLEKSGPSNWILSNHSTGWGSYQYDPKNDALRVPVNAQAAPYTEFLTYAFDERRPSSAVAFLQWENKRFNLKIDVPNVNELYVAQIRKDLQSWPGFNYNNWQNAAQFCASNKINLDEALIWADKAISEPFRGAAPGREDFSTLQTKAAVLSAMSRTSEADTVMQKAIHLPVATVMNIHRYGVSLLAANRNDKAMEIFRFNREQHPDEKFVTNVGLARGYTALGDKQKAISYWETALQNVPENQERYLPLYQQALKALKDGTSQ